MKTLRIIVTSLLVCVGVLLLSGAVARELVLGVWQPRRVLVMTLPFALLWALIGVALLLRAIRGHATRFQAWLLGGGAAGLTTAGASLAFIGSPTGYPGESIGVAVAGALCGVILGSNGWLEAHHVAEQVTAARP